LNERIASYKDNGQEKSYCGHHSDTLVRPGIQDIEQFAAYFPGDIGSSRGLHNDTVEEHGSIGSRNEPECFSWGQFR
jgi:hypothetical protein